MRKKSKGIVTHEEAIHMNELYERGLTSYEVGDILGRSFKCVTNNIKKVGGSIRDISHCGKKYSINEDYFKEIDTQEKSYWLGFIAADGNITKNKFSIGLWETDKYILEQFANDLNFNGKIYIENGCSVNAQKMHDLTIFSKNFCNNLRLHGIIDNKTNKLSFSKTIPEKYYIDFLRGIFDGDGCVTYYQDKINGFSFSASLAGAKQMMLDLQTILNEKFDINSSYFDNSGKNGKRIKFSRVNSLKFLNLIYKDDPKYFLVRKYNKYKDIIENLSINFYKKSTPCQEQILIAKNIIK